VFGDKKLWKELIRLLSVEGQPTMALLSHICVGVFFIRSVSDAIFGMLFLPKPLADRRGPRGEPLWATDEKHWCRWLYEVAGYSDHKLPSICDVGDHHHHHDAAVEDLDHLLTRSGLTHPEVSSVVFPGSFCLLGCSFFFIDLRKLLRGIRFKFCDVGDIKIRYIKYVLHTNQ
jgi:hypothetical protein